MQPIEIQKVQVIDSHTGGEPTRVVIAGGPDLGGGRRIWYNFLIYRQGEQLDGSRKTDNHYACGV